ncbi:amino acid permease/ SLC12A domain-containing protein [Scheffersomyces coipomensis]|uniref:amino acid permease/ SLC12A domain-containing protein n=1 Tax=Scheffersomyces coipomensis TaxID=1788519 RepID=UPI00315D0D3B
MSTPEVVDSAQKKAPLTEVVVESDIESLNYSSNNEEEKDYFFHENRLSSALKSRHIAMITLVGVFGTGLFLSSSVSLSTAGPVGMLLAYIMVGLVVGANQMCITEVACFMPVTSGYVKHSEHFIDEAVGFTMGWCDIYSSLIPNELSAVAVVMSFWSDLSPAIWITVFGLVVVLVNIYNIKWYGEIEFFFGCLKILLVVGLILTGLIIDLGGVPGQKRLGFHYWRDPGPFAEKYTTGSLGKFAGFWKCVSSVVYAYGGTQAISMLAGETEYPRRAIFRAAKRVFYRVFTMYLATVFILTLIVAHNDPAIATPNGTASGSPFVIAMERAGIKVLPHIINAVVLTSALSAANLQIVKASRTLFALATKKQAPAFFLRVNRNGLPWIAVGFACLFVPLCYMSVSSSASTVFSWLQNVTSSNILFNWIIISINHIYMTKALKAQGYTRKDLPYKFYGTEYAAWFSLFFAVLFLLTGGFPNFIHGNFEFSSFFTSYFIIPLSIILYAFWKLVMKSKYIKPEDVDLKSLFADIQNKPEPEYPKLKGWQLVTLLWA